MQNSNQVVLVKDINPGSFGSYPSGLTEFDRKLYFTAPDEKNDRILWVSDNTKSGTQILVDTNPDSNYYYDVDDGLLAISLTEFNGKLYFSAGDGENGNELWVSDGTKGGTQLLIDINPNINNDGLGYGSIPDDFTELNGKLYFSAYVRENGRELWVSDGTTEGTQLVLDILPRSNAFGYGFSSNPRNFTELNGKLYFTANDGENGEELWVSDGTTNGTQLVKDISPVASSTPDDFTKLNGKLYFSATDGVNNTELWVSDGTTEGT